MLDEDDLFIRKQVFKSQMLKLNDMKVFSNNVTTNETTADFALYGMSISMFLL